MNIFFYRYKIFLPEQAVNLFLPVNRVTGKKIHNPSHSGGCAVGNTYKANQAPSKKLEIRDLIMSDPNIPINS